jgi:hypothetical protein
MTDTPLTCPVCTAPVREPQEGLPDFGTQTSTRSAPPPTLASARQRRRCPLRRFAAPDPAPLDVKRLARALDAAGVGWGESDAIAIASEYAKEAT